MCALLGLLLHIFAVSVALCVVFCALLNVLGNFSSMLYCNYRCYMLVYCCSS